MKGKVVWQNMSVVPARAYSRSLSKCFEHGNVSHLGVARPTEVVVNSTVRMNE